MDDKISLEKLEALIRAYEKAREKADNELLRDTYHALLELWTLKKEPSSIAWWK